MTADSIAQSQARLVNENYFERLLLEAIEDIRDRSSVSMIMHLVLFFVALVATPFATRYPEIAGIFGCGFVLVTIFRAICVQKWQRATQTSGKSSLWEKLFPFGYDLSALLWAAFCSFAIAQMELGWTAFFLLLITFGVAAASVPELVPNLRLMVRHLGFVLIPPAICSGVIVGGLKGYALASLLLGFFTLLIAGGQYFHRLHRARLIARARMNAMIDAFPGTLSWVNSELEYLGVNMKLARSMGLDPKDFRGKKVGFIDPTSPIQDFIRSFFASGEIRKSAFAEIQMINRQVRFLLIGQKYNLGKEAVVIGVDLSTDDLTSR